MLGRVRISEVEGPQKRSKPRPQPITAGIRQRGFKDGRLRFLLQKKEKIMKKPEVESHNKLFRGSQKTKLLSRPFVTNFTILWIGCCEISSFAEDRARLNTR